MENGAFYYQPPVPTYPPTEDELYYEQQMIHGNMLPNVDSMDIHQMEDTQHIMYMQDLEAERERQELEQMRQLQELQELREYEEHISQQFPVEELPEDEVEEIRQLELFEQMQQRLQSKLESGSLHMKGHQKQFAEELEPIDNPEFHKQALPKYSTSARSVQKRLGASARNKHIPRHKSHGRITGRDDRNQNHPSQHKSRRLRKSVNSNEVRESPEPRQRSNRPSKPVLSEDMSNSFDGTVDSVDSDEGWKPVASPLEIWNGMVEGINTTLKNIGMNPSDDSGGSNSSDEGSDEGSETSYESDDS